MSSIKGFLPIADKNANILILGSMPSVSSLQQQQYYAHKRNAFWPIMISLFGQNMGDDFSDYVQRRALLLKNNIAVWDVLQSCDREGSLDSAIKVDSVSVNNFNDFFLTQKCIKTVFFNGAMAEKTYSKYVLPGLQSSFSEIDYHKLPSTSPAHAAMTIQQKTECWKKHIKIHCN